MLIHQPKLYAMQTLTEVGKTHTIYVKAMSGPYWFGSWAPVEGRLEWLAPDDTAALFTLNSRGLDADDEYEFYQFGTLVLCTPEAGDWRARAGMVM